MAESENLGCDQQCEGCDVESCSSRTAEPVHTARKNIKHVIGVVSGKGGVGKSMVTTLLANELVKQGASVGILDADVTGPSIPKAYGMKGMLTADNDGIIPIKTVNGIEVVSVNLMLPSGDMPVAWRGPIITGLLNQFRDDTNWEDLDYLLVDMPPGTSDVFLTVLQSFKLDGLITVSAPQELVSMIVGKAVNLAREMNVPVLGLVENMAYFECDQCGKKHYLFGEPQGAAVAEHYNIPSLATLPLDPNAAHMCDEGKIAEYDSKGALDPIISYIKKYTEEKDAEKAEVNA